MKKREDNGGAGRQNRALPCTAGGSRQCAVILNTTWLRALYVHFRLFTKVKAEHSILQVLFHTEKEQSRGFTRDTKARRSKTWEGLSRLLASENAFRLLYSLTLWAYLSNLRIIERHACLMFY